MTESLLKPRIAVYVDGFNFYFRRLRNTPFRWLNLQALFESLFPEFELVAVHYFTARVSGKFDANKPLRQAAYLRALATLDKVHIQYGLFTTKPVRYRAAEPLYTENGEVKQAALVWRQDEKGSDVNLGVRFLHDALKGKYDVGAMLTNDSDLTIALQLIQDSGTPVVLIHPDNNPATSLAKAATMHRHIHDKHLRDAQFPDSITTADGKIITKPDTF